MASYENDMYVLYTYHENMKVVVTKKEPLQVYWFVSVNILGELYLSRIELWLLLI